MQLTPHTAGGTAVFHNFDYLKKKKRNKWLDNVSDTESEQRPSSFRIASKVEKIHTLDAQRCVSLHEAMLLDFRAAAIYQRKVEYYA